MVIKKTETDIGAVYYFPIDIKPVCLSCHGQPVRDISKETFQSIDIRYPYDTARGYWPGELN